MSDPDYPCIITLKFPFPTPRLAQTALKALSVDPELSPLVRRHLSIPDSSPNTLQADYSATTNRMLRVSVNTLMESLKLVTEVMEQLDEDVLGQQRLSSQSVENHNQTIVS